MLQRISTKETRCHRFHDAIAAPAQLVSTPMCALKRRVDSRSTDDSVCGHTAHELIATFKIIFWLVLVRADEVIEGGWHSFAAVPERRTNQSSAVFAVRSLSVDMCRPSLVADPCGDVVKADVVEGPVDLGRRVAMAEIVQALSSTS